MVLKNWTGIVGLKSFLRYEKFLVIFSSRRSLVMSTPKPGNLIQSFLTFAGVPVWPKCLLYVPGISINPLLNLFRVNSWIFSFFHLLQYCWGKVKNEGNIYENLNNCHNCFFMLCSYENNSFSLVVIGTWGQN